MTYLAVENAARRQTDWKWVSVRRIARLRRDVNSDSTAQLLALSAAAGVEPRPESGGRQLPSEATITGYWLVRVNDLVFNPMWAIEGGVAVSACAGAVSTAYRVYELHPDVYPRFAHYWFRSSVAIDQYRLLARGITTFDRSVTREDFEAMPMPLPPSPVQRAIAGHLDRETARIDKLIATKRKLVALAAERFNAVADLLTSDPTEGVRIRRLIQRVTTGSRDWADRVGTGSGYFIRSGNLKADGTTVDLTSETLARIDPPSNADAQRARLMPGDVLIGVTGANTGWIGYWEGSVAPAYVSQHVAALRPACADGRWLSFALCAPSVRQQILSRQYGGTKQGLGLDDVLDLRVRATNEDERRRALPALMQAELRLARIRDAISGQIARLEERRQAMITAIVTGQVQV